MARNARDLLVRWIADVNPFLRDTDKVQDALQDTSRYLDDVADTGDDSARRLARAFDRAGDQLRRSTQTTGRTMRQDFADTGREAGAEFAQNLGQSLSSGDASRIVQDSAGGLVASLAFTGGVVGAAVAAGSAIALGLWNAFDQKTKEQEQRLRDSASSIFQGILSEGTKFVERYRTDVLSQFFDPATTDALITNAKAAAEALNIDLGAALAGGPDSVAALAEEAYEKVGALQDLERSGNATGAQRKQAQAYEDVITYLDTIIEGWGIAEKAVSDYNRTLQLAAVYAERASSFAPGGSAWQQQLGAAAPYVTGYRD